MKNKLIFIYRWIMWNLFSRPFVHTFLKSRFHFHSTAGSHPFPPPPFIVVANHGTFFDPWLVGGHSKYPLSIMCNDDAFLGSAFTRWYLRGIGAFPKKKGASDFKAMKITLSRLAQGYAVCIFPEGQTTWDGETQPIYKGIEKIIKRARCPLVMVHLRGNFLSKPWWAHTQRRGKVSISFKVLSTQEVFALSDDEVLQSIRASIYQNDIKDPINLAINFSGERLALGLERFIWICPRCGVEDTLLTHADTISCTSCQGEWSIDAHCRISQDDASRTPVGDLYDWSQNHKKFVRLKIADTRPGDCLTSSSSVVLQTTGATKGFVDRHNGTLSLTHKDLTFISEGTKESQVFDVLSIEDFVIQKKDIFEITFKGEVFRFLFSGHSPMKWIYYIRYLRGYGETEQRGIIDMRATHIKSGNV